MRKGISATIAVCGITFALVGCGGGSTNDASDRASRLEKILQEYYVTEAGVNLNMICTQDTDEHHFVCRAEDPKGEVPLTALDVVWGSDGRWVSTPR